MFRFLSRFLAERHRIAGYSRSEAALARTYRELGMSEDIIKTSIEGDRIIAAALRDRAASNPSTAPTHGVRIGTRFQCADCGQGMVKVGIAKGFAAFTRAEIMSGVGGAEECRECGRVYCQACMPRRPPQCLCGINQDAFRIDGGVTYRGSFVLTKVQYENSND
jgi:hypothetical protein